MNQREKTLAIIVGSLLGLFLLSTTISKTKNQLTTRLEKIKSLDKVLKTKKEARKQLNKNRLVLEKLKEQSLCLDPGMAQSQYKSWLFNTVKEVVAFSDPVVTSGAMQKNGDIYLQHSFKVTGKGDLAQLTKFLFTFYEANYLHRIRQLSITPLPREKNRLSFVFAIDAASLQDVAAEKQLSTTKADALANKDINYYFFFFCPW